MEVKKTILSLLTIFVLGPLIFVGTCFPIGIYASRSSQYSWVWIFGVILGFGLAIWAITAIIKRIDKK